MIRRGANDQDWNHWNDGLGVTVWQEAGSSVSALLGPDGRPLPARVTRMGFDLRPVPVVKKEDKK